eukprot:CAMPEP_0182464396 /NCGR_PEP_ID=MMETSP1319-20130603/8608_1 /TAXON_ID=172717 /ORGANISM="Bolidomonas pacifica, Strain RCC208" /LENGTH=76 /DNA_ID=CAMNT_0024664037 /DNA_START=61 /DNA_END=287 /DNA_ORIENTATION=-
MIRAARRHLPLHLLSTPSAAMGTSFSPSRLASSTPVFMSNAGFSTSTSPVVPPHLVPPDLSSLDVPFSPSGSSPPP